MGSTSTIEQLPADILEQLQTLLRDPRVTQLEATQQINAILEQQGEDTVSKSAVNRYAVKMKDVGAKLQQSREMAQMWIGKLGAAPQGQVGKLINEIIRTMAFDTAMHMSEDDEPVPPKLLAQLALAVQRLESAANMNEEREKQIRKEMAAQAAEAAEKSLHKQGLTQDKVDAIKRDILGLG
jgi:hypothetical protein